MRRAFLGQAQAAIARRSSGGGEGSGITQNGIFAAQLHQAAAAGRSERSCRSVGGGSIEAANGKRAASPSRAGSSRSGKRAASATLVEAEVKPAAGSQPQDDPNRKPATILVVPAREQQVWLRPSQQSCFCRAAFAVRRLSVQASLTQDFGFQTVCSLNENSYGHAGRGSCPEPPCFHTSAGRHRCSSASRLCNTRRGPSRSSGGKHGSWRRRRNAGDAAGGPRATASVQQGELVYDPLRCAGCVSWRAVHMQVPCCQMLSLAGSSELRPCVAATDLLQWL